jgi:hypothetical protein
MSEAKPRCEGGGLLELPAYATLMLGRLSER